MQQYSIFHRIASSSLPWFLPFQVSNSKTFFFLNKWHYSLIQRIRYHLVLLGGWGCFLAAVGFIVVNEMTAICLNFWYVGSNFCCELRSLTWKYDSIFWPSRNIAFIYSEWGIYSFNAIVHGQWRLNATKYILDIKLSTQMKICISGRCRLNGIILFLPLLGWSLLSDKFAYLNI